MYKGKMTATWLILLTIAGCSAVPVLMIFYTTVLPFAEPAVADMIIVSTEFIPKVLSYESISSFHYIMPIT